MAGGGQTSTSLTTPATPEMQSFIAQTIPQLQAAQQAAPLSQFMQPNVKEVAGLSPSQQWAISQVPGLQYQPGASWYGPQAGTATPGTPEEAALAQLSQLTSGAIGSSPTTLAGLQAFQQLQQPQIENTLATMGLGRSGAGAQILETARAGVLGPLLQQEISNRQAAVPQYANLGQNLFGRQQAAIGTGMQVGGTERGVAQEILDAKYNDWIRRQQLSAGITTLGGIPQATQQTTSSDTGNFFGK